MPERHPPPRPAAIGFQSRQEIVEQRLQRAQVEHRQPGPSFGGHPGQHGEGGGFGLASRRGGQQEHVLPGRDRGDRRLLERAQLGPAERADQVVRKRGMKPGQLGHRSSSTSSADAGRNAAALRSTSVSSVRDRVSL